MKNANNRIFAVQIITKNPAQALPWFETYTVHLMNTAASYGHGIDDWETLQFGPKHRAMELALLAAERDGLKCPEVCTGPDVMNADRGLMIEEIQEGELPSWGETKNFMPQFSWEKRKPRRYLEMVKGKVEYATA